MIDKPYDNDTEYQLNEDADTMFPQEEEEAAGETSEVEMPEQGETVSEEEVETKTTFSKRRLIYSIIFLILIALAVYKIFNLFFGAEKPAVISEPAVPEKLIPVQEETPVLKPVVTPPVKEVPIEPKKQATVSPELENLIKSNKGIMTGLQQQQANTQNQIDTLSQKISGLEDTMESLQNTIDALNVQMQRAQASAKAASYRRATEAQRKAKALRQASRYYVKAVIPGRAWLKGVDGSAVTIAIGEDLPGYGKVTAIDAYSGVVSTSSGVKIQYGINN